jgi:hypothetical protein
MHLNIEFPLSVYYSMKLSSQQRMASLSKINKCRTDNIQEGNTDKIQINNVKKNNGRTNFNSKTSRRGDKSIFMYRQSDHFPLPVSMMGLGGIHSKEQATAPLSLFKQSANKRRSQEG